MKYQCGPFIYDLPETACAFCQEAHILWDYSNGMYMINCPHNIVNDEIFVKGCDNRKPFPEGTEFVSEEYKMRFVLNKEGKNKISTPYGEMKGKQEDETY